MSERAWLKPVADAVLPADVHDFWAAMINPLWSRNRVLARIAARRPIARDAVALELRPNRNHRGLLPGQHLNVTVEIDGVRHVRSYSPSVLAGDSRRLEITV
ncbi:MAG: FAD-binding oxidoreductase, partial [Perlucidibaca sp.]